MQTSNKRTHVEMKNKKNNYYFKCHKFEYIHRDCSEKNKRSKTINCHQNNNIRFQIRQRFASVSTTKQKRLIKTILIKK